MVRPDKHLISYPNFVYTGVPYSRNVQANPIAFAFMPTQACQLVSCRIYIAAPVGSVAASDIVASLQLATGIGNPNGTTIASTSADSLPSGAGVVSFTFSSPVSLDALRWYYIVISNNNSNPTTNYISCYNRAGYGGVWPYVHGMRAKYYTGSAWSQEPNNANFEVTLRVAGTDSHYGVLVPNTDSFVTASTPGHIMGVKLTTPSARMRLCAVWFQSHGLGGTLSDYVVPEVRDADFDVLHTDTSRQYAHEGYTAIYPLATPYWLEPNTTYYIGLRKVSGSNTFRCLKIQNVGLAALPPTKPFRYDGTTVTEYNEYPGMGLLFDGLDSPEGGPVGVVPSLNRGVW